TGALVSVWHDLIERPSQRRIEVLCELMWCAIDGGEWLGPVRWTRPDQPDQSVDGSALVDRLTRIGANPANPDGAFVAAVREARPAYPDFSTALRAHLIVDAAYRSAALGGQPVEVPPPVATV
ncbi:MAG: hypothetical protein ACRD1G_15955, partial [Acidimicrobiales bacterium]